MLAVVLLAGLVQAGNQKGKIATLNQLIEYYDSTRCQECHAEIYAQWQSSHHAKSLMGIKDYSFMSKYLRQGPLSVKRPEEATLANFSCAKCHLPQLLDTSDQVAKQLAGVIWKGDKQTLSRLNIGCLVCHQSKAVVHHRPESVVIYGRQDMENHEGVYKKIRRSAFMNTPAFCGQCHGLGPNFEFTPPIQCATLYGSYLHGYVANGGARTCNDCHMPKQNHSFPPNFNNRADTTTRLRAALPLEVEALSYTFQPDHQKLQPMVVLGASIRNRAGHRIPDG
ncbi:MAG: multiheme c-type cytochrome (seleno)protein ExtKL [Thermodesulfobacteriota bacterium]